MREQGAVIYLAVHKPEDMDKALKDPDETALAKAAAVGRWWEHPEQD